MALTKAQVREILSAAGVDREHMSDAVDKIIDGHLASINVLREEADKYKGDAEKLPEIQKELEQARADLEAGKKDSYKVKYEAIKEEFEGYKKEQTKKDAHEAKEKAYRELLKAVGVSEKRIDAVLKVSDVDGVELDEKGQIKDAEKLAESVKTEWADFIGTTTTKGADTANPPANTGKGMSREDIYKKDDKGRYVLSTAERQKAIAENHEQFGI